MVLFREILHDSIAAQSGCVRPLRICCPGRQQIAARLSRPGPAPPRPAVRVQPGVEISREDSRVSPPSTADLDCGDFRPNPTKHAALDENFAGPYRHACGT